MKLSLIFVIYTLFATVKGAFWAAAAHPIILSLGVVFSALNLDAQPILDINWRNLMSSKEDTEDDSPFITED